MHLSLACFVVGAFSNFLISSFSCITSSLSARTVGSLSTYSELGAEKDALCADSKCDLAPGPSSRGVDGEVPDGGGGGGGGGLLI